MSFINIFILAIIQGLTELLPVSSSAHVIVAEKLMGLDPAAPEMTFLLIMLHTGTMFAEILYFWNSWRTQFFASRQRFWESAKGLIAATMMTGVIGLTLKFVIEKVVLKDIPDAEIELIFGNLFYVSIALASVGILIIIAGLKSQDRKIEIGLKESCWIGAIQGLCLPFRGFSRSGATISTGLLSGVEKTGAENFSFALAVILTPPIIVKEVLRLLKVQPTALADHIPWTNLFLPGLIGMGLSFIAGLLALRWLSRWLEGGRWYFFGCYDLVASVVILFLHFQGL